jgi:hypothetical protein
MNKMDIIYKSLEPLKRYLKSYDSLLFKVNSVSINDYRADGILTIESQRKDDHKNNFTKSYQIESLDSRLSGNKFIIRVMKNPEPRYLRSSISDLHELINTKPQFNPIIISDFIGPGSRNLLREESISYIDTLGNAGIFLKDCYVIIEGNKSMKREYKILRSIFAPKSSRVIRVLLENFTKMWKYEKLSKAAKVSLGQTYKIIDKLLKEELLIRKTEGITLLKPGDLLDQWSKEYILTQKNSIDTYYLSVSNYEKAIQYLASIAENEKMNYAFSLFAGCSMFAPFVRTNIIHMYLKGKKEIFIKSAGLKPVTSGANVHLISPYDDGIFNSIQTINRINVVGNIQLYLDLINYPSRGKEQADFLREKFIGF